MIDLTLADTLIVGDEVVLGGDVHLVLSDKIVAYDYPQRSVTFGRFGADTMSPVDSVSLLLSVQLADACSALDEVDVLCYHDAPAQERGIFVQEQFYGVRPGLLADVKTASGNTLTISKS